MLVVFGYLVLDKSLQNNMIRPSKSSVLFSKSSLDDPTVAQSAAESPQTTLYHQSIKDEHAALSEETSLPTENQAPSSRDHKQSSPDPG